MIVRPAANRGQTVRPALLADETHAIELDTGRRFPLDKTPPTLRVFAAWDDADRYARAGHGELVAWGDEPIRWRHGRHGDSHRRHSDAVIVKLPVRSQHELAEGLVGWADWLADYDVDPGWSLGGSSMNLLRATLDAPLVTTNGELPDPRWTLGGRQQAWLEPGSTVAGCLQLDLQAAYTTVIGQLRYGGCWRRLHRPPIGQLEDLAGHGCNLLVRAHADLPDGLACGPLHDRPQRKPAAPVDELAATVPYPVTGSLHGIWTWQELQQAIHVGARVRVHEAWLHTGAEQPFLPWQHAIMAGRQLPGFAGQLAKATGNALWGQFVIDDRKRLAVQRWNGRYTLLPVQGSRGHQQRAWDLGELVTGAVRAKLYDGLRRLPAEDLVCCHTDGFWLRDSATADHALDGLQQDGWRLKTRALELQLIDQQKYRYRRRAGGRPSWRIVCSGIPAARAADTFEQAWQRFTG